MKITKEWLHKHDACISGQKWFLKQDKSDLVEVINALVADGKRDWANWTICQVFNKKQNVMYAIFAAEQVIDIFEKKYPDDKRPRLAIEAAKNYLKTPSAKTKNAAADAAGGAYAAYAACAAYFAAAAADARKEMKIKILNYGLSLLQGGQYESHNNL
jgi:hypothetical protein